MNLARLSSVCGFYHIVTYVLCFLPHALQVASASHHADQVLSLQEEVRSLRAQLSSERQLLTQRKAAADSTRNDLQDALRWVGCVSVISQQ